MAGAGNTASEGCDDPDEAGGVSGTGDAADFESVLHALRRLPSPCEPPVGVGSFDLLYANEREVVVWYSPAREGHLQGEVAISCARLAAAWAALTTGEAMDEEALVAYGGGLGGGRWLLALLAQLPGVRVREEPLALLWDPGYIEPAPVSVPGSTAPNAASVPRARRGGSKLRPGG
jgi:hypothetical protein